MIGCRDIINILRRKFPGSTVNQVAHIAGIDEEDFIEAVAESAFGLVAAQEPQTGGNPGIQKQLDGQVDNTVHHPGLQRSQSYIAQPVKRFLLG